MALAAVPEKPLLKPWYRLCVEDGRVVLDYAQSAVVFDGAAAKSLLPALLPLLDGEHGVDEIVAILGEPAAPAIAHALGTLSRHRLLASGDEARPSDSERDETLRFLAANVGASEDAAERLARARVRIAGSAQVGDELARLLGRSGVTRVVRGSLAAGTSGDLDLVAAAPTPAELAELAAWNETCLGAGVTWLAVLPYDGRIAAIGPLFVPGETCCYDCFRIRRASTSGYAAEFWALESGEADYPDSVVLQRCVAALAAWIVLRWLTARDASLPGAFHALELGALSLSRHEVWRVPRCPSCSEAVGAAPPSPWFEGELR
jgi:bacteriocin biosynthesis cyclodehydratase domain-containing protein